MSRHNNLSSTEIEAKLKSPAKDSEKEVDSNFQNKILIAMLVVNISILYTFPQMTE